MEIRVEAPETGRRELFVSVETEQLTPKFEKAYQDYKKKIVLGGFRKGRVPVDLIKRMFGKTIRDEVIDGAIPEFSQEAISEQKLKIIPPATIDAVEFDLDKGLTFKVLVELQPDIEIKKISGFEFEREILEADPAAIDLTLESLREQHATMQTIDSEAKDLDYVIADMQEIDATGVPLIGKHFENQQFRINSQDEARYQTTAQLLGAKAGDVRRIQIELPGENDENPKISYYEASIKEVQTKILPELDDEFAKDLGDYETLVVLKESIMKNLIRRLKNDNAQRFQSQVLDRLVKENSFDVPEKMVEFQINVFLDEMKQRQQKKSEFDYQALHDEYRPEAVWSLKWQMIRNKIVEMEKWELTDEDYEAYYQTQADLHEIDLERLRNRYRNEAAKNEIESIVWEQKIVNHVVQHSTVTEKIKPYSDILRAGR